MTPLSPRVPASPRHDVAVIGAGPAGSATAIRLAQAGMHVRLYEKARFPRPKLCGGFLSPECLQDLEEIDVLDRVRNAGAVPIRRIVISSPWGGTAEAPLPRAGLSLSRETLGTLLVQRARESGVELFEATDGFNAVSNETWTIVATGRHVDAETQGRAANYGIHAFFDNVDGITDQVELDLIPQGYVGFVRQAGRVNVCALINQPALRDNGPDLDSVLRSWTLQNPLLARRLREARRASPWQAIGPVRTGIRRLTSPQQLFVGDAACVVDPFVGEGIAMGLRGAALVQRALNQTQNSVDSAYEQAWHKEFDNALRLGGILRRLVLHPLAQNVCVAGLQAFPPALTWLAVHTRPLSTPSPLVGEGMGGG